MISRLLLHRAFFPRNLYLEKVDGEKTYSLLRFMLRTDRRESVLWKSWFFWCKNHTFANLWFLCRKYSFAQNRPPYVRSQHKSQQTICHLAPNPFPPTIYTQKCSCRNFTFFFFVRVSLNFVHQPYFLLLLLLVDRGWEVPNSKKALIAATS